jgi:c(7)-type cytochrome triheme protein
VSRGTRSTRRLVRASWVWLLLAGVASVAGCRSESRSRVLVFLFEDGFAESATAVPVVRGARYPPPPTPTATAPPSQSAHDTATSGLARLETWDDVLRLLPKDRVGNPDWGRALEENAIVPRPGAGLLAAERDVLQLDVEITPESNPALGVTFSHEKHGAWLACDNCHSDTFAMRAGATPMSASEVHFGRLCAACHGKVAFDVVTGCPLCHLRTLPQDAKGRVDWSRALAERRIVPRPGRTAEAADQPILDLDVELTSKTQPPISAVFSHATHTQWLACGNCHPRLFRAAPATEGAPETDWHSRGACGACHGSVAFGITYACERCHPKLEKTKQHQEVFDLDVEVEPRSLASSHTMFSHKTHRFVECSGCHTDLFPTAGAPAKMTMTDLVDGKYCAACHGKVASDLIAQCQRCHSALGTSE